jgi:hypothetical protein
MSAQAGLLRRTRARDWLQRQAKTTISGHPASAPARTRSARPSSRPAPISSVPNHTSRPSSTPAATAQTPGRSPAGTRGPRLRAASGQTARVHGTLRTTTTIGELTETWVPEGVRMTRKTALGRARRARKTIDR